MNVPDQAVSPWLGFAALALAAACFFAVVNSLRCLGDRQAEALRAAAVSPGTRRQQTGPPLWQAIRDHRSGETGGQSPDQAIEISESPQPQPQDQEPRP